MIKENIISSSNIDEIKQKERKSIVTSRGGNNQPGVGVETSPFTKTVTDISTSSQNANKVYPKTFKDAITISKPLPKKSVTLLVYMVGSNLENTGDSLLPGFSATKDIKEMIQGDPSDKINVVLATGGSSKAEIKGERTIDFTTPSMQQLVSGSDEPKEIARLGTKTMASHNTERNDLLNFYMDSLKLDTSVPTFNVEQNNNVIAGTYDDDDVYEINFYFTDPIDDNWLEVFHTDEYDTDEDGFKNGEINFPWDGYETALCNAQYCYPISPDWAWGERDFAYLPIILYSDVNDFDGLIGSIIYDITDEENGIFVGFLPSGDRPGDVTKQILDLNDGNVVQIRAVEVTKDFKQTKFTKVEDLLVDKDFRFSWEIFDWGKLEVFVEVCDFSGNCAKPQGPFTMDPRNVPNIDMSKSYPSEQNDLLNPDDEVSESYDQFGNYDSVYFDNLEFISMDEFCIELHSEFDNALGWEEVNSICDDERDYNGDEIDRKSADQIINEIRSYTAEIQYYDDQTSNDDSVSFTYFCEEIHNEFDDELGWKEVEGMCTNAQLNFAESIPIDNADQYWYQLGDKLEFVSKEDDTTSEDDY